MSASNIVMFGIPNCDTIKKARRWLSEHNIEFTFHDYRKDGVTKQQIGQWCKLLGWEAVLNKRGTTYRQLSDEQKAGLDESAAIDLLEQFPAMIKRPLLQVEQNFTLGFKADLYQQLFFPEA
ncbi:ArsC family reductase [Agarivorans sp. Toyoura001]|uniref:ArsC family reductase n=1 Tax=unclassified Agarivorans TaxID=2636026 RepID=UPI0010D5A381|nr:ArsC family reductase [Agarivorans sp. Toyoura001]GDY27841.1 arsenate reductase [Agarivorans sp. Toyoura001]